MPDEPTAGSIASDQDDLRLVELARRVVQQGGDDRQTLQRRWQSDSPDSRVRAIVTTLRKFPELVAPTARFIQAKLDGVEGESSDGRPGETNVD